MEVTHKNTFTLYSLRPLIQVKCVQFSNVVLDLDGLEDVEGRQARWLEDVMEKLNCTVETDC